MCNSVQSIWASGHVIVMCSFSFCTTDLCPPEIEATDSLHYKNHQFSLTVAAKVSGSNRPPRRESETSVNHDIRSHNNNNNNNNHRRPPATDTPHTAAFISHQLSAHHGVYPFLRSLPKCLLCHFPRQRQQYSGLSLTAASTTSLHCHNFAHIAPKFSSSIS